MLSAIKQFNDSKRVCAVYGMVFATSLITAPLTIFGLLLMFGDADSWAKLGGLWLTALGLGVASKTVPEFIKEYKNPSDRPDKPMNLWLPVLLIMVGFVALYAEHGEHGGTLKDYVGAAPAKLVFYAMPGLFKTLDKGLANGIEDYEKAK
ncbi:hypothetical protein ACPV5U_19160 [Vibrio mediterranei]